MNNLHFILRESFVRQFLILITSVAPFPIDAGAFQMSAVKKVLSVEGGYFYPKRDFFREIYGKGFPALGVRVDVRYSNSTWVGIKGRFLKMTEDNGPDYINASLGVLLRKGIRQEEFLWLYAAAGPQLEYRRISYLVETGSPYYNDSTLSQIEWSPSLACEAGIDLWFADNFRMSPHIGFTYFPLGDPTRGDFGDTGGFYFVLGMGFRL